MEKEAFVFPASFAQARLWFLDQWEPHSFIYNVPAAFRLSGPLSVTALEQSLNEIVRRHEALRTTFAPGEADPVQVIAPALTLELPVVDLRSLPEDGREAEAQRLAVEEARLPFDLAKGPLLRVTLLRLDEQDHLFLLTAHHIVTDAWSMAILFRELAMLYAARCSGKSSSLSELPIQYADFAQWQRQWLQGEVLRKQLAYWKQQLDGAPSVLELPADQPRPALKTYRGATQSFMLSKGLTGTLKALNRQEGVTLFMTLLAAFKILLYRYTGQEDIVVGSPIAGRNRVEIETLIGFFVNTLVLRTDLSGNPTFRELLGRVRETALGAYAHQELPFEKLVEELQPKRDLRHTPIFQVMFILQNAPYEKLELSGLDAIPLEIDSGTAKFDLTLSLAEGAEGLSGTVQYNTDVFEDGRIHRMVQHFRTMLESIVANPNQRLSKLPLLAEPERKQLLVEWNDTRRDYPQDKRIHQLFEAQVERTPDRVAVVFEDGQLTYSELNVRANRLAHYLKKSGVGPEVAVGIFMERCLEMIIAVLGVAKAGGAYLPLDPGYPQERLAFILEDAQVPVLLTQQRLREKLSGVTTLDKQDSDDVWNESISTIQNPKSKIQNRVGVCLDSDWDVMARQPIENLIGTVTADNLAYVLYTSGSTGIPKGVLIEHGQILNYVNGVWDRCGMEPGASFAMVQPLSVDSSQTVIFPSLVSGGCLHVISEDRASDPQVLSEYFRRFPIDLLKIAPSHLAALQMFSRPERIVPRRWLIIGGEASRREWVEKLEATADANIINHYGPTEATVGVLTYQLQREETRPGSSTVPVGRPLPNTQAYLLDRHLEPVPIGVPGELHIGGDGLARGYLNRSDLTAERFIPNPFSDNPGARLYKTGDQARYLPDGNIEFLGRIDNQVKIRGFRIELGEIEAVLGQHPGIGEAVVVAREDSPGDKRLVAYVVPNQNLSHSISKLRHFLKEKLPDYMVPSSFVLLDALPRTPHGKLDRKALPTPDQSRFDLEKNFAAPRSATEKVLAQIWAKVLRLERIGAHDNFFDLGGHSLLAIQVISRIRNTFQTDLALRSLFEAPTVAELAERIESTRRNAAGGALSPIVPEASARDYPLSFAQERFWFLDQLEPNDLAYRVSYGFRLSGPLNIDALERSLTEIVRRHQTLRTTFQLENGKPLQVVAEQWSFRIFILDLSQRTAMDSDAEVQRLFEEERRRPFNLTTDLLLRATLLRLSTEEHVLFLNTHHIAWDHWCIELFFRELSIFYQAFAAGEPSPLPEPPIQYKHYALWQRKIFEVRALEGHRAYWKRQLSGAPPSLNLPTDYPRKPLRNRRGKRRSVLLPNSLAEELKILSRKAGASLFMTFLAAFQTLLYRITGEEDIVVGAPVAGRDWSETEGLIGLFLNSLALRTDLSGNPTFLELLTRVREVALGAYDHQDFPFEKLVEELQPERDLTQTAIFQVFINMYNFKEAGFELDRLSVQPLKTIEHAPLFDIEFYIREHDDGIHLVFGYDSDLFEAATIARMLDHFQVLLRAIVANPERRLSDLPILTDAEKHRLLVEWNNTGKDYPRDKRLHQLFEEQVKRTPDAVALVFEDQRLTYWELNRRANQLARHLQKLGVGPEALVGVCMERSVEMVAGLVGILKAGGAYVPLDPDYPKERLSFMLQDTQTRVLLTQQRLVKELFEDGGSSILNPQLKVICLDTDWELIAQQSDTNLVNRVSADNLAYVIYTSGSTGQPKGAGVPHRAVNRLVMNADYVNLEPTDVVAQVSNCSFDAATFEIWGALLHGAKLVLISTDVAISPKDFAEQIEQKKVSVLFLTTALFNQMAHELPTAFKNLRYLLFGGEAADPRSVVEVLNHDPPERLLNVYGPTEATTFASWYRVESIPEGAMTIPIGRPIANTEIYVLDPHLQPVPIGVPGELYIGGDGLARGYRNRPELTAEKFIPNSLSKDPGARLYKTGDLVRYLPDGNIDFLGRMDNQVKIRGFRIELGEIESVLSQHPAVQQAVVLAREDIRGDKGLVAYVVPNQQSTPTINDLRTFLKQKLPDYMVPSTFVMLDALPLTPNGKLDRRALPIPDGNRPELEEAFLAPRTPVEEVVGGIWAEVLGIERVGMHDNFFELGGHSLLATQVISRVRAAFAVELPLRALFESPTVASLAVKIAEIQAQQVGPKDIQGALADLELLSDEEAERLLVSEKVVKEI